MANKRVLHNNDDTVNSQLAAPFSQDRGVVGWTSADGFTVGIYGQVFAGQSLEQIASLTVGNRAQPTPANVPGFAAYDQLDYAYLRQTTAFDGKPMAAGNTYRWAMFVLVGTVAQVQAAALQLAALQVNAQWVD